VICVGVGEDQVGRRGAEPVPVIGAAADLSGFDPGLLEQQRGGDGAGWRVGGGLPGGVRGGGAFVGEQSPRGGAAGAGGGGRRGVAGGGVRAARWVPWRSMVACAGRKQAGAPCPAPGATVTSRSSRSAITGTSSVSAAERVSHPGAVVAGSGVVRGVVSSAI